jgi:17beta-estradiol 17-dehydrogenase / very-long-chain 3-oxoacyl-CoA reductase
LADKYGRGSWVLITGGSTGIGAEYAKQMAAQGFNLILVALFQHELEQVQIEIKRNNPDTKMILVEMDLGKSNQVEPMKKLFEKVKHLDVSLLFNNVGVCQEGLFHDIKERAHVLNLNVNVYPHCLLTKLMLPKLLSRPDKIRGGIICMSSFSGSHLTPAFANYGAAKAFVRQWCNSLMEEYKE